MMHRDECDPAVDHLTAAVSPRMGCGCQCHRRGVTRLPGRCVACGRDVVFNGRMWMSVRPGVVPRTRHVCPPNRPRCGAFMPVAKERCDRRPHRGKDHRSRYAMDNERRAKRWASR